MKELFKKKIEDNYPYDNYLLLKMTSKIMNTKIDNNEDYLVLTIETNNNGICEFAVSNGHSGLEWTGLILGNKKNDTYVTFEDEDPKLHPHESLDEIKGSIISVKYVHNQNIPKFLEKFKEDEYMTSYINEITTTEGIFYIGMFNEQNGYYPHEYYVKWSNINGVDDFSNSNRF